MTVIQLLNGLMSYVSLAVMLWLLIRGPRSALLGAVTVAIACFALSYTLSMALVSGGPVLGLEPIVARLIQHLSQLASGYSLIVFILYSALDDRSARRRALWHAVPFAVAAAVMTVATVVMPAGLRDAAAALALGKPGGPVAEPSVALFYLTVNVYRVYAFATVFLWTRRYARRAGAWLRRGLALASVGLAVLALALSVLAAANIVRWTGGAMPRPLLRAGMTVVQTGFVVLLAGFVYPAVRMRLAAMRVWWQHRKVYHQLGPLWTVLNRRFPEDELSRMPSRWWERLRLFGVHRRYYRRVIECRDGLVRISPYLGPDDGRPLADRLREGLAAHASGSAAPSRATRVAIPSGSGLDADVRELVALSEQLRATESGEKGVPRSTGLGVTGSTEPPRSYTSSGEDAAGLPAGPANPVDPVGLR